MWRCGRGLQLRKFVLENLIKIKTTIDYLLLCLYIEVYSFLVHLFHGPFLYQNVSFPWISVNLLSFDSLLYQKLHRRLELNIHRNTRIILPFWKRNNFVKKYVSHVGDAFSENKDVFLRTSHCCMTRFDWSMNTKLSQTSWVKRIGMEWIISLDLWNTTRNNKVK